MLENLTPTIIEITIILLSFAIPVAFWAGKINVIKKITKEVKFVKGEKRGFKKVFIKIEVSYKNKKIVDLHPVKGSVTIEKH